MDSLAKSKPSKVKTFGALLGLLGLGGTLGFGAINNNATVNADVNTPHVTTVVNNNQGQTNQPNYTVKAGDSLWQIAQNYGTTVDQIKKDNNLTSDFIQVGQKLFVRGASNTAGSATQSTGYQAPASTVSQQAPVAQVAPQSTAQNSAQQAQPQNVQNSAQSGAQSAQAVQPASAGNNSGAGYSSNLSGNEQAAKNWIAAHESGGNYGARNGQ